MANHLLTIGIDKYPLFTPPHDLLTTCVKDVTDLKYVLLEKYYFDETNVIELLNENATGLNIQKSLEQLTAQLNENSNLVIYFSGHGGLRISTNKGYWIPCDANEENFSTWLPNETLLEGVKKIKSKHIFIIADCCFSSSLLITNPSKSHANFSLDNYKSRWILTSGREKTYCGSIGENSFFGECLLSVLGNSESDIRVGTIVEYVKERFKANVLQQPQGYPMLDPQHDLGELLLKIKDSRRLFENDIQGYNLFKKVIARYKHSKNIEEIKNYEDKTEKIGFTLLRENDTFKKEVTHYLYLYKDISQTKTHSYLKAKYNNYINHNLYVFLSKEDGQIFPERRLSNIVKLFNPKDAIYIDDFINYLNKEHDKQNETPKYLNIRNFVLPEYKTSSYKKLANVEKWLSEPQNPILIIKGMSGIGKTTFAKYLSDYYQKISSNNNVLFIDSNEVQEELLYLQKSIKKIDLFTFYKAAVDSDNDSLDTELFSINVDAGILLLIIDGLDEILSRNINFNVTDFFSSIERLNAGMGKCKIIITTRTYFWEKSKIDDHLLYTVELLPFDFDRAKTFFEKSFKADSGKIKKAFTVSEDFKLPSEDGSHYYHPFVLDIIREIIDSNNEILFSDKTLSSSKLKTENKFDYIVGRICEREVKRVQQIDVDLQIKFFIYVAVKESGKFSSKDVRDYLRYALSINDINKTVIEAFKSHPFLHYNPINAALTFKYDFFENYFISLFVSELIEITNEDSIDFNVVKLLSQKLYHGSDIIKNVVRRSKSWSEDNILKIKDIIATIYSLKNLDVDTFKRSISGLLNLALAMNSRFRGNDRHYNTILVKQLFSTSEHIIENLVLLNLNSSEDNVRFDFSGLKFQNCVIENYTMFWECNLTETTFFLKCVLKGVGDAKGKIDIPHSNFIDCDDDNSIYNAFQREKWDTELTIRKAAEFLEDFLKIFYKNGKFKRISEDLLKEQRNYGKLNRFGIKLDYILTLTIEMGCLSRIKDKAYNEYKITVDPESLDSVSKFITERKPTPMLLKIIADLAAKL